MTARIETKPNNNNPPQPRFDKISGLFDFSVNDNKS